MHAQITSRPMAVTLACAALVLTTLGPASNHPAAAQDHCQPRPITPIGRDFFTDISDASGIRDQNFDPNPPANMRINDHSRVAFADINGDGFDDMVAHNLFPNPQNGVPYEHLVFLNDGDGTFTNFSDESGLRHIQAGFFLFGDIDNDGDQDAFAGLDYPIPDPEAPAAENQHRILLNDGQGHFSVKPDSGVDRPLSGPGGNRLHVTGNAVFADFDGDGDLDLYLGNGHTIAAAPDQLFLGNGDGTFTEASERLATRPERASNGTTTRDYDNDGDQDILISVYGVSVEQAHNLLYENDGQASFADVARARGFQALATGNYFLAETGYGRDPEPGVGPEEWIGGNGFGLACGDVNNDGRPDVLVTNISHPVAGDYRRKSSDPSKLLINQGPDDGFAFENSWLDRQLPFNEGDVDGALADFDNDGYLDISLSRDRKYERNYQDPEQKSWFGLTHQLPDGRFESVGLRSGINDTTHDPPALFRMKGAQNHAWSDIDHDGDLDLLVGGRASGKAGRPNFLFANEIGSLNDWLVVRLKGDGTHVNRDAVGARAELVFVDRTLVRQVTSSRGMFNSMDTRALHFGLGDLSCDYTLIVTWPDGQRVSFDGHQVGRNRVITLSHAATDPPPPGTATPGPPGDILMTGRVYDSGVEGLPIPGATVAVTVCLPRTFQASTNDRGEYELLLPAAYVSPCQEVSVAVRADGYVSHEEVVAVAELRLTPARDFALQRVRLLVYLPHLQQGKQAVQRWSGRAARGLPSLTKRAGAIETGQLSGQGHDPAR